MVLPGSRKLQWIRPPNSDRDIFWCKFGFGKWFGASSCSNHWAGHCWWSYKTHFSSHVTIWSRNGLLLLHRIREDDTSKWFFFTCGHCMRPPLIELFHLSNLLQLPNDCRMVDVEFLSNFSCSCKGINFNDPLSGSTSKGWPLCCWSSMLSSPLQNSSKHHWLCVC